MRTFKVVTLGCKVNQYEGQVLHEKFLGSGFREAKSSKADIYIVNTCTVTGKADKESAAAVRSCSRRNPGAKIVVTGCCAESMAAQLKKIPGVISVVSNSRKEGLLDFIPDSARGLENKNNRKEFFKRKPDVTTFYRHTRAFLKIQDGCNNACSYCIVPKVRGPSRSRQPGEIVKEAIALAGNGYKEIVLCGICMGSYGKDLKAKRGLVEIIRRLEAIPGLLRIRLSSIEAYDVGNSLIEALASSSKLCRHLHIPFQSGDNRILKAMNRRSLAGDYISLVSMLRRRCPGIGISTDIIAGFPGEDEPSFARTVKFLREISPSRMHVFPFSPRRGTMAFSSTGIVPEQVIKERVGRVRKLASELSCDFCRVHIKSFLSVLVESGNGMNTAFYKGYSDNYIKVFLPKAKHLANSIVRVKVLKPYRDGVWASLV